jgi:hypothetical protein
MKHPKVLTTLALAMTCSFAALSAKAEQTVITYTIHNQTEQTIVSTAHGAERVEPNTTKTFTFGHDFKISNMRDGDTNAFGHGAIFTAGDKSCNFYAYISLAKVGKEINATHKNESGSLGKERVGCIIDFAEASPKAPYNFGVKLVMMDLAK